MVKPELGYRGRFRILIDRKSAVCFHSPVSTKSENLRMKRYAFHLRITPEQYLDYYRGAVRHVIVRSTSGQTVQFPASLLQRFVVKEGIYGNFVLVCDDNNKCIELQRALS